MAIRRRQLGMKSGHKPILELRLYNQDGSRNFKGEGEYRAAVLKRAGLG